MRIWIGRIFAICFGLLLAFSVLEVTLRLFPQLLPPVVASAIEGKTEGIPGQENDVLAGRLAFESDPDLSFRPRPNQDVWVALGSDTTYHVRTNSRGLRSSLEPRPANAVALGDSFTFGDGVNIEDTWVSQLESLRGWTIANLGITGYGPQNELEIMRIEGLPLRPKLVIWQLFVNDFADASSIARWEAADRPPFLDWRKQDSQTVDLPEASGLLGTVTRFLHRHVASYELLKYALGWGPYYRNWKRQAVSLRIGADTLWLLPQWQRFMLDTNRPEIESGRRITQETLLQARDEAEEAGAEFVVVVVPTKEETYWPLLQAQRKSNTDGDLRHSGALVVEFCQQQGLRCIDLYDRFVAAGLQGRVLYFSVDGHWTVDGHRLAAQVISDYLFAEGLLP